MDEKIPAVALSSDDDLLVEIEPAESKPQTILCPSCLTGEGEIP